MNDVAKKDSYVKKHAFNDREKEKRELLSKVDILRRVAVLEEMGIDFTPFSDGNWLSVDEAEIPKRSAKKCVLNLGFMYSKPNKKWYYTSKIPRGKSHKSTYIKCAKKMFLR